MIPVSPLLNISHTLPLQSTKSIVKLFTHFSNSKH